MRYRLPQFHGTWFLAPALSIAAALTAVGCGSNQAPASPASPRTTAGTPAASSPAAPPSAAQPPPSAGTWRLLPPAPVTAPLYYLVSAWTGSQMLIHGTTGTAKSVTLSYAPATGIWRTLPPGPAPMTMEGWDNAIWTGTEMLAIGPASSAAYNPATNTWRPVSRNLLGALGAVRAWTGHQEIFWGGGCCSGALADGAAYTPATDSWQPLPPSPLSARYATGAWTGTELIIAGGSRPPGGTIHQQAFADAAAYNPATHTWRKLPPMPEARSGATALWDGTEVLYIGGTRAGASAPTADGVAFNPSTGRWRRLPAMEFNRSGFAAVWTGHQVLIWGGWTGTVADRRAPPHGVAYDPTINRWTAMPIAPLRGRSTPTAVWTGHQMIVWGGIIPGELKDTYLTDGAAYRPAGR